MHIDDRGVCKICGKLAALFFVETGECETCALWAFMLLLAPSLACRRDR